MPSFGSDLETYQSKRVTNVTHAMADRDKSSLARRGPPSQAIAIDRDNPTKRAAIIEKRLALGLPEAGPQTRPSCQSNEVSGLGKPTSLLSEPVMEDAQQNGSSKR